MYTCAPMRVTFVVHLAAGLARGGLELQAENTRAALEGLGVDVRILSPEDRTFDGDIVHFFGTYPGYPAVGHYCRTLRIPYVCTPVLLVDQSGAALRWRAFRKRYIQASWPREQAQLYRGAARLLTLTSAEERNLDDYFGGGLAEKVRIPIGVDARFHSGEATAFTSRFPIHEPFVLVTGRLEKRKNQLGVIRAMKGSGRPLVLIGGAEDKPYLEACQAEGKDFVHYLGKLDLADPALAGAYAAARVFCMPSGSEVLSASALEAAVAGLPLVLGDAWGAQDIFGGDGRYVRPGDIGAIRRALDDLWDLNGNRAARAKRYRQEFDWRSVGQRIVDVYHEVVD